MTSLYCHTCLSPLESTPDVGRGGELIDLVRPCARCLSRRGVRVVERAAPAPAIPPGYQLVKIPEPRRCHQPGCGAELPRGRGANNRRWCKEHQHAGRLAYKRRRRETRPQRACRGCPALIPRGSRQRYCPACKAQRRQRIGRGGQNGARARWDGDRLLCVVCGTELPRGRGRPRSYCEVHRTYRLRETPERGESAAA